MQFVCQECDRLFSTFGGLRKHIGKVHKISRKDYAFKWKTDDIVKCTNCNKEFFCEKVLQTQNKCCSKSCSSKFYHKIKENAYREEIASCIICGAQFIKDNRNRKNKKCCSKSCAAIYSGRKRTPEQKKLKWKKRKQTMLNNGTYKNAYDKTATKVKKYYNKYRDKAKERAQKTAITKTINDTHKNSGTIESIRKCHETKKKNGTYGKSKAEDLFYEKLKQKFQKVYRQIKVNSNEFVMLLGSKLEDYKKSFTFDFAIVEDDSIVFVCFDGTYYHGLDRPITEIANLRTKTDKTIFETYYRDRYLEDYVSSNGDKSINIIKVTDGNEIYFSNGDASIINKITSKI